MAFISKRFSKSTILAGVLSAAAGLAIAQTAPATRPAATSTAPAGSTFEIPEKIATVNGTPITNVAFIQSLYVVAGPRVLGQMLDVLSAQEAARLKGVVIKPEDAISDERKRLVGKLVASIDPAPKAPLTRQEEDSLLGQFAQRQGLTPMELGWRLQQTAYLRALGRAATMNGKPAATVSDEQLNDEFQSQFGDKANVKVYVFEDPKKAQEIVDIAVKQNKKFDAVADEKKIPWQGVVIPKADSVQFNPAKFKDAIKDKKEGEYSAWTSIEVPNKPGTYEYVILYVDKLVPKVTMTPDEEAKKKADLKGLMQESAEITTGNQIVNQMRKSDEIHTVINDPTMAEYVHQMQMMQQGPAPATAPATAPAH